MAWVCYAWTRGAKEKGSFLALAEEGPWRRLAPVMGDEAGAAQAVGASAPALAEALSRFIEAAWMAEGLPGGEKASRAEAAAFVSGIGGLR